MAQPADFKYKPGVKGEAGHRTAGRGVCGNFRFKFFEITNCDDWNSIVPNTAPVMFACATNNGALTDTFGVGPLNIESTADGNTLNELQDSAATFSSPLNGQIGVNEDDGTYCRLSVKDADECLCYDNKGVAKDNFPDGNEPYNITNDRCVELNSAAATYEGYLIVLGK